MELGTFEWRLIGIGVFIVVCYIIAFPVRRARARNFVLAKKSELRDKFAAARKEAAELDAGRGTLAAFSGLETEFRQIELLNPFTDTDWIAKRELVISFEENLAGAVSTMRSVWKK